MTQVLKPFGTIDPNSQHQLWSRWTFTVHTARSVPLVELKDNAGRWLHRGFGSVGRFRVERLIGAYQMTVEVEGVPAHDPDYVQSVRSQFNRFVFQGFGPVALGSVDAKVLAGDRQDGQPRDQLIVVPGRLENA